MPLSVQFLSQAIVGTPDPASPASQATTDATQVFSGGLSKGLYTLQSDKVLHVMFGADGTTPTAVTTKCRIPANQLVAISVDCDVEMAIIRGADETANGTLWVTRMLDTARKFT